MRELPRVNTFYDVTSQRFTGRLALPTRDLTIILALILILCSTLARALDNPMPIDEDGHIVATYHFKMLVGEGVPVCQAFLERLNTTKFTEPPYCGIPDKTTVDGFEPLTRVFLSPSAAADIAPQIIAYMRNQSVLMPGTVVQSRYQEQVDLVKRWAVNGALLVWRYVPPVSVGNDGTTNNVLMWQEPGCGQVDSVGSTSAQVVSRSRRLAFVLSANNQYIDDSKTVAEFGDPHGIYQPKVKGYMRTGQNGFRSIGTHMGILKYHDTYYVHTFLDPEAVLDLSHKQVAATTLAVANTLIVLVRRKDITHKICQYQMMQTPPESNPPMEPRTF